MATNKRFKAKNGLDNNNQTLTNLATPVNASDAVSKAYSDNASNLSSGTVTVARMPSFSGAITTSAGSTVTSLSSSSVLSSLLTVDGSGSLLDADLLDGQQGNYYAPIASPSLTGTPTAPTAAPSTSTTQVATTAFVQGEISGLSSGWTLVATKTSNYTAADNEQIPCNTSAGSFNITLPSSGKVSIFDVGGETSAQGFGVNSVFIIPPGGSTVMEATSLELDIGASAVDLTKVGTDWRIVGGITAASGGAPSTSISNAKLYYYGSF